MNLVIIPILCSIVILNVILSVIVLSRGVKNNFNLLFGVMSLTVAVWSSAIIGFYTESFKFSFNWIALTHSSALLSSLVLLYFSLLFPSRLFKSKILLPLLSVPFVVSIYYLFFTNVILGKIIGVSYQINSGYIYYELLLGFYFVLSYIVLFLQYKKESLKEQKQQIKYVFIGAICASFFGMITNLILPSVNIFSYTWLGPVFTLILVGFIFVAILKYHLFNIKIIVTEIVSILLIVALSVEIFIETNTILLIAKLVVLLLIMIFSYLLIKSVKKEITLREKIENLAKDLEVANSELEKANDRLKELDQLKSEFLSLATHQIRAPLTAIKGYASLMLEGDYGKLTPSIHGAVQTIFNSCQNLVVIVTEFLDISRIEQGRMKYDFVKFDINKLVEEVITELKPTIEKTNLSMEFKPENDSNIVFADQGKVKQVIGNIIDNSIKYTPKGGVTIKTEDEGQKVKISISDTGIGVAPEDISKLFTKFTRAKDAFRTNVIGTGLGLYVAKQMIEAQKGKIWVESEGLGKGSTFFIELPKE